MEVFHVPFRATPVQVLRYVTGHRLPSIHPLICIPSIPTVHLTLLFLQPFPQMSSTIDLVQTFGKKKSATAVAHCKAGKGMIKVSGCPVEIMEPEILRLKLMEPVLILGKERFANVDIRASVRGGGQVAQAYAIRQAIAKALVAYHQKFVDEASKQEIRDILIKYDRSLLVADPRRCEPKKFGGPGARARYQKSYR